MSAFSVNQNRHLYVAKAYSASVNEASAVGTIGGVKLVGLGKDKELVFNYKGADSTMTSDRISLKNLDFVKAVKASDMIVPLKVVEVTLDSNVNGGNPVSGQDYVLGIDFRQWVGIDEKHTYYKSGVVHATASMTASDFYKKMVESLNLNFRREIGATKNSNPYLKFEVDNATTATKLIITEKPQGWSLGTESQERVYFSVRPTTIYTGGEDVIWGKAEDKTPAKSAAVAGTTGIGNGTKIADLEYFCMGERGDQYRLMGWPNYVPTTYLVDPTKQYNVLEFHFAYTDEGTNSYRSEKDITVVAEASNDGKTALNGLISAINTATGLEIATIA